MSLVMYGTNGDSSRLRANSLQAGRVGERKLWTSIIGECSDACVPVGPSWRADQHTLPAHDVVDIAHQVTQDQFVGTGEGEGSTVTAQSSQTNSDRGLPHELKGLSSSGSVCYDVHNTLSHICHLHRHTNTCNCCHNDYTCIPVDRVALT